MFNLFKKTELNVEKLMDKFDSHKFYISNGYTSSYYVGGSGVSDEEVYNNKWMKIGLLSVTSGRGDWGGGFEYSTTPAITVTVDNNLDIQKFKFDDFYNSDRSKKTRREVESYINKNKFKELLLNEQSNLFEYLENAFKDKVGVEDSVMMGWCDYEINE